MKKTYYIVSLAIIALFTSCSEDYNLKNFPGYTDGAIPTNVVNYKYTLTAADYTSISNVFKKPIADAYADSISKKTAEYATATTKADSTKIKLQIDTLNIRMKNNPTYVKAMSISTNRCFADSAEFVKYIPTVLSTKYLFVDDKSIAEVTFNLAYDTTKIAPANRISMANPTDYALMGTATGLPGRSNYFSADIDPNYYIPIWLKDNNHYAKKGDLKLIRYRYSASNVVSQKATVFIFDGASWVNYNATDRAVAKFKLKNNTWEFSKSDIFIEKFAKDFGTFTPQVVVGAYTWTWGSFNGGCFVANAYQKGASEIWMVSPIIDLKERVNPTLSFDHALNYGANLPVTDLTGVYISTNYTNDVTKATWTKMSFNYPSNYSWTFLNSGKINLSGFVNQQITIGFKYVSTGTAVGWEVSNVNVLDE